jgi:hypothetical protein
MRDHFATYLFYALLGFFFAFLGLGHSQAQSLTYNQTIVLDQSVGVDTVPQNKTWKIVNAVNAPGQMTVSGAVSTHCGSTCGGGWCGESSCFYVGHLFELNGVGLNPSNGCHYCGVGSPCSNGIANCPATHTFTTQVVVNFPSPFWLKAGNTLKVNAGNLFFSIIEFNIVP